MISEHGVDNSSESDDNREDNAVQAQQVDSKKRRPESVTEARDSDSDSSESDDREGNTAQVQQPDFKKRRQAVNQVRKRDKKRKASDDRDNQVKQQQSQLTRYSGASNVGGTSVTTSLPPSLASLLLAPDSNSTPMLDPNFYCAGSEPLRRWMHFSRNPNFMQAPLIDPYATSVASLSGVAGLSYNTLPSVLPRIPFMSSAVAAMSNPSFTDVLNLATASRQQLPLNVGLSEHALAAQFLPWRPLYPQQNLQSVENIRRFLEASIAMEDRDRTSMRLAPRQERLPIQLDSGSRPEVEELIAASRAQSKVVALALPEDDAKLNEQQAYLRRQIEVFQATEDDILSHTRGRNKPIMMGQVGIRCRHCGHLPVNQRRKGSTYFPSSLMGIYQAAQNLSVEHLHSAVCTELPPDVKSQFLSYAETKPAASGVGKPYWAESGKKLGLVDTDYGIRFAEGMDNIASG